MTLWLPFFMLEYLKRRFQMIKKKKWNTRTTYYKLGGSSTIRIRFHAEVVVAGLGPFPTCLRIDFVDLFDWCS